MVFVENGVAFGFAHFLQDDLLGGLRSDAAQNIGGFAGQNFRADFGRGILAASIGNADFASGVGNVLDHGQNRENVHLTGFGVEFAAQVFFGLVILARRDDHRILDRRHHDFRLDVLLAAEHFNLLIEQIRHNAFPD